MPSHILYLDDSGTKEYARNPDDYSRSGNSRYFVFGGMLLRTDEAGRLVEAIRELKAATFGTADVEIKSNWLRIPWERERRYLERFGVSDADLATFVDRYYGLIGTHDLQLLAAVVDKVHMQEDYPDPWYAPAVAYEVLLQRVVQAVRAPETVSVTVDDMTGKTPKGSSYKRNLAMQHEFLRQRGSRLLRGLDFSSLTGTLRFVNSAFSHQVQVADVVAYNVYRQFVDHGKAWEERPPASTAGGAVLPTYQWFEKLGGKFRQGPGNRVQGYGVVKFPLRHRIRWSHTE